MRAPDDPSSIDRRSPFQRGKDAWVLGLVAALALLTLVLDVVRPRWPGLLALPVWAVAAVGLRKGQRPRYGVDAEGDLTSDLLAPFLWLLLGIVAFFGALYLLGS